MQIPTPAEARDGCQLALENAVRHLRCGEALALSQEYGIATSHMVLAAEEALKSIVLAMLGDGIDLPPSAVASILTQHKPRLIVGALLTLMQFLTTSWVNLITSLNQEHPDSTAPEYAEARRAAVANLVAELNRVADASQGEAHIIDVMDWWAGSNLLKQRGFYMDLEDGNWVGPFSLTESDFRAAFEIASEIVGITQRSISIALDEHQDSREEFVQSLNNQLREWRGRFTPD